MTLTRSLYAMFATLLVAETALANDASTRFGQGNVGNLATGSSTSGFEGVMNIINDLLALITLAAVAYVIWAGWQILSAGGDEEKVKQGRKTMINVLIGIVVMWLAYWIVTLVLEALVS